MYGISCDIQINKKKQGESVDDIWQLCHDIEDAMVKSIPETIRWFAKRNIFSKKEVMNIEQIVVDKGSNYGLV